VPRPAGIPETEARIPKPRTLYFRFRRANMKRRETDTVKKGGFSEIFSCITRKQIRALTAKPVSGKLE
jgi:hypothetical protein